MKVGILQADSVMAQFEHEFGDYPGMFQDVLSNASSRDIEFAVYDVEHEQYPNQIDECHGYVITGSRKSVYDDEPWIHRLRDYVVALHKARIKLVGICFGHQIVAMALGGNTEAADAGWGVGVHESHLISSKPYMQPRLSSLAAIVSHKDQVTHLPDDAELLATSDFCPNSMFQIQEHILTYQGHPEFCKGYSRALMDMREDILGEEVYRQGVDSLNKDMHSEILSKWIVQFIEA
jgi:GMP synthase-like glutamine amidotransferase